MTGAKAIERFDSLLGDIVHKLGNIASIAAIQVDGERYYFEHGRQKKDDESPANRMHIFQIGSQSKTFIAVAMLMMDRKGLIKIDRPVVEYLDLPISSDITVRHLLMNTSGLGEYTVAISSPQFDPRCRVSPRDLVGIALTQGQLFEPGSHFDYCNTGWVIAAMIIEAVTDRPYSCEIRNRILIPLGLQNTSFGGEPPNGPMLHGYHRLPRIAAALDTSLGCVGWRYGAGDGLSSLDDLLAFYDGLVTPGALEVGLSDLIACSTQAPKHPFFAMSIGARYGLGLEGHSWTGREAWGHPGSTGSYLSSSWLDAEMRIAVTTCVTREYSRDADDDQYRYPRSLLFGMALNTAYAIAAEREQCSVSRSQPHARKL